MAGTTEQDIEISLKGRDFIGLVDYAPEEIQYLIDLAINLKKKNQAGEVFQPLKGKTLGMIFEKSSTRTRVSFEVGMYQLGGHALFLSKNDLQLGRGETIHDTAQTMSRYLDGIMIRTYAHRTVIELARGATVPVINGLTDLSHPCQALADYQTIQEKKGRLQGLKMAYIGDGNNMVHSLMMGAAKLGMNFAVATPQGYEPDSEVLELSREAASKAGSSIWVGTDPVEAIADADVVYTDVWASMGFEAEQKERELAFKNFQVNEALVKYAKKDYLFMHCLPAHRGEEVSEGVIDGANSVIFDQAENRLHAQKAVMAAIM
ncbi:ornithine carbamoyltransferase [Paenibacillus mucilaginosus]|uniref:Ornithine carbamoyltransferase n=2 Tax=Paenibacillus mucilaginosus TaxID=61624 RepID=H6NTG1_9BACL|nr:ornithine carbamoyltransferase [Paenibacillus mucilaginosus]AEI38780.1 ArgF [Paenibacillus mucilaginosus KNP414]AFC27108.1 ArgF [Paenibacillus mucilaginosus 3016]MCG7215914.1 ornithine carbamoyltransferase [Paenibacillus mucilaginosus]WDM27861.1 ornithine carbamoyltransferase [Paenibacillus mucilaginosus]WFA16043.1 ornithine carbamoyltransferase [Paenibacillus mucilaginosus]